MADTKISALTALTGAALAGADLFPVVDTSATTTKKISFTELQASPWVFTGGLESHLDPADVERFDAGYQAGIGQTAANGISTVNVGPYTGSGTGAPGSSGGGAPVGDYVFNGGRHAGVAANGSNDVHIGHAAAQYAYGSGGSVILGATAAQNGSKNVGVQSANSVLVGSGAASVAVVVSSAVMLGHIAGYAAAAAAGAVGVGLGALQTVVTNAAFCTAVGYGAANSVTTATYATIVGKDAGGAGAEADYCVYVGYQAGMTANRAYTLAIEADGVHGPSAADSLIYGEFDNRVLVFNGTTTTVQSATGVVAAVVKGKAGRTKQLVQLQTSAGASLGTVGGCVFDHFADGASTHTDGTEDTLYTDTTAANTLAVNGDAIEATYTVQFVSSATATRRVRIYFAGVQIYDSGTLTFAAAGTATFAVTITRATSTTCRATVVPLFTGSATILGFDATAYTPESVLISLTLTATNILKITGVAASTGAAGGDITAVQGKVWVWPAA